MRLDFEVRSSNPSAPLLQATRLGLTKTSATDCDTGLRVWETCGTMLTAILLTADSHSSFGTARCEDDYPKGF